MRTHAGGVRQPTRPPGLARPPHQAHAHSSSAGTQAPVCLSYGEHSHTHMLTHTLFPSHVLLATSPNSSHRHPPPPLLPQLPSHPATPSRHSESRGGSTGHGYHTLPHPSYGGGSPMWGPLEPPSTPKPWSLSCLRPAPPLRPSAALGQKEVLWSPEDRLASLLAAVVLRHVLIIYNEYLSCRLLISQNQDIEIQCIA